MTPPIDRLKALAHPARFAILAALGDGEAHVGEIERRTGLAQPGLSQQLAILRDARWVTTRRAAKLVHYALDPSAVADLAAALAPILSPSGTAPAAPAPHHSTAGVAVFAALRP